MGSPEGQPRLDPEENNTSNESIINADIDEKKKGESGMKIIIPFPLRRGITKSPWAVRTVPWLCQPRSCYAYVCGIGLTLVMVSDVFVSGYE